MKVLMFGWEFPPHISGGLGTACFGLTKSLIDQKVQVLFVVPRLFGDEKQATSFLVDASKVSTVRHLSNRPKKSKRKALFEDVITTTTVIRQHRGQEGLIYLEVASPLSPYENTLADSDHFVGRRQTLPLNLAYLPVQVRAAAVKLS